MNAPNFRPPNPMQRHPILVNADGEATHHVFVETRPCTIPARVGVPASDAWEFVYECSRTGQQRRWGLVERHVAPWIAEGN